jgi:hypothetical protein
MANVPMSSTVEDLQNFGQAIESPDYNDTLDAMRYMQMQRQPQGMQRQPQGIIGLPQVSMQEGGEIMAQEAMVPEQAMPEQMMQEQAMPEQMMQEAPQQEVQEVQRLAQGLAGFGREGDTELVHMNPEELSGLHSMGTLTYNPVTGLPEAFGIGNVFKAITKPFKAVAKGVGKIAKSKAFKTIAPIALAIAAPYALGAIAPGVFGPAAGLLSTSGALGYGVATGLGSLAGGLLSGQSFGDSLKGALISGGTSGLMKGLGGASWTGKASAGTGAPIGSQVKIGYGGTGTLPTGSKVAGLGGTGGIVADPKTTVLDRITDKNIWGGIAKDIVSDVKAEPWKFGKKILAADLGSSLVEMANQQEQAAQQAQGLRGTTGPVDTDFNRFVGTRTGGAGPGTLTQEDILRQATMGGIRPSYYGNIRYGLQAKEGGGLMNLARGGEFKGMVPGEGGGMEDNVYMPIKEGNKQVGTLAVSPTEYVVDSHTMAALGNGNPEEGAKVMDGVVETVRKKAYGTIKQPKEIDGIKALGSMMKGVS